MSSNKSPMKSSASSVRSSSAPSARGGESGGDRGGRGGGRGRKRSISEAAGSAQQVKVACQCAACREAPQKPGVPGGRPWAKHEKVGTQDMPVGDLCLRCDRLREEVFGYMTLEEFLGMLTDKQGREDVEECQRIEGGGGKSIDDETVGAEIIRGATIEKDAVFFNATDYKTTFGARAPTGTRYPSLTMPKDDGTPGRETFCVCGWR